MKTEIKLALVREEKSLDDLAGAIGRSKSLVSLILNDKHKGYEHRPKLRQLLKLKPADLPDRPGRNGKRRAA